MGLVAAFFSEAIPGGLARKAAQGSRIRASARAAGLDMFNIALFLFQKVIRDAGFRSGVY